MSPTATSTPTWPGGFRKAGCILALAALLFIVAGCAPAAQPGQAERPPGGSPGSSTLVLVPPVETASLNTLPLFAQGGGTAELLRLFNAGLTLTDANGRSLPYLAENIPQLGTDSWTVFPDGKMDTVYRLRTSAVWHDGTPLRASDFVFAWRLMTDPEVGLAGLPPQRLMEEVAAPDDLTLHIRWSQPYPDAARIDAGSRGLIFPPLPRHLLESAFEQGPDALRAQAFWTLAYVGAGPYQLDRWEQGSFIEARAFGGHVLGRPKIDRLKLLFAPNPSAALAYLMSGEGHLPINSPIRLAEGLVLKDRWTADGTGVVEFLPATLNWINIQLRPEYANPRAILDLPVRRALTHAIDKAAINEGLFGGTGKPSDTFIAPTKPYFPGIEPSITHYPYDPRRAEQLMNEAGLTRDGEGIYAQPGSGQLSFEYLVTTTEADLEKVRTLIAAGWRQAGFRIDEGFSARGGDRETAATFRSMASGTGFADMDGMSRFTSGTIARLENRWVGENMGGWSNPAYDRAAMGVQSALDPTQRIGYLADAVRAISEDLGVIFLYYSPKVYALPSRLRGIQLPDPDQNVTWNIYEWEFQ